MRTQLYYPHVEIRAIALLIALSFAFLFSLKAQELPTQSVFENLTSGTYAPASSLIGATNDTVTETTNTKLVTELKSMMSTGSYWFDDKSDQNMNLTQMLADWMKNGLYWEEEKNIDNDFNAEPIAVNDEE